MSHTNLILGANWWRGDWPRGEWPDYIEVGHEDETDCKVYVPERTCHNFGGEAGTNGEGYDFACSACGWCGDVTEPNYCLNCGAKVVNE